MFNTGNAWYHNAAFHYQIKIDLIICNHIHDGYIFKMGYISRYPKETHILSIY